MAEVALQHVGKQYARGILALDDLTLTVADGELVVLVGPSGCGKTTTLRLIAGLETLTTGSIRIDGKVVDSLSPRQRDVALVFQRPTLYPHLSVADNLAFGARMRQADGPLRRLFWTLCRPVRAQMAAQDRAELAARVADAARVLGLEELLSRRPGQLSGGQQQRLALGRALVRRPAAFLLDEPLSNLDPALRHEMRRELHLLQRRLRATMLYVTHDQVEAMTLGDRVVVLDRGKVQQVGLPEELYRRPANRFVAGFLGWPPMNFFDARLIGGADGRPALAAVGQVFPLPAETFVPPAAYNGLDVTAGIRPEHVAVTGEPGTGHLTMDLLLSEPLGGSRLLTLERDGRQLLALVPAPASFRERQTVEVSLDLRHLHLFDRLRGTALLRGVAPG